MFIIMKNWKQHEWLTIEKWLFINLNTMEHYSSLKIVIWKLMAWKMYLVNINEKSGFFHNIMYRRMCLYI